MAIQIKLIQMYTSAATNLKNQPDSWVTSEHFNWSSGGLVITWLTIKLSSGHSWGRLVFWNLPFLQTLVRPPPPQGSVAQLVFPGPQQDTFPWKAAVTLQGVRSCETMCSWVWSTTVDESPATCNAACAVPDWWQRQTYYWRPDKWK